MKRFILFSASLFCALIVIGGTLVVPALAQTHDKKEPLPARELRDLNSYFPFKPPEKLTDWEIRKSKLRKQLQVALGLWPMPEKKPLKPTIDGLIDQGDYTIEKVYFEILDGLHVTGVLYKPKNFSGKIPGIASPLSLIHI